MKNNNPCHAGQKVEAQKKLLKVTYKKFKLKKRLFIIILIPIVIFLIGISITFGSADISFLDVYKTIAGKINRNLINMDHSTHIIIWKLRLPRVIMGLLAGIALGTSGAVMQVVLRNPLADPYMLGIASSAGFGASLAMVLGIGIGSGSYLIIGNAFLFSMIASFLILAISGRRQASPEKMVLTGLALLFFFQAMTTLIQYFGEAEAVKAAVFWTIGDLGKADWWKISIVLPFIITGTGLLVWRSRDLNIMNTGDASAQSLGVNVQRVRITTMLVCTLMVATVVSFTGTIGFVGLVAPHIVRIMVGNDNTVLVPASGLTGAALLVLSDAIARSLLSSVILPVGAVTSFLGVPLFLYLIMIKKGEVL